MVFGIGTDIVEVKRIKEMLLKHGEDFLKKIFTEEEIAEGKKRVDSEVFYAGRWAAKEAIAKALQCGIGENCAWKEIKILKNSNGMPFVELTGKALKYAKEKKILKIHVSISHELEYAIGFSVIEHSIADNMESQEKGDENFKNL